MAIKVINAILWRSYLAATSSALWGLDNSQYYIELTGTDFDPFFGVTSAQSTDERGNKAFTVKLEDFDGSNPTDPYDLKVIKLRDGVARAGNYQVLGQRESQAYPLWQSKRGPQKPYQEMDSEERSKNFMVVVRDSDGLFHARWIRPEDFAALPQSIQALLVSKSVGWSEV